MTNSVGQTSLFIVEDNFMYSYLLEAMLKEYGNFKITTLTSGEDCIEMLENNPKLIILDYNLEKGLNGLDTFKIIHSRKPKIPVIIISSQTDVQVVADLLKLGVFDYIEKKDKQKAMEKLLDSALKALKKNN
jgi:two-component system, OmpR family, response regulator